ncbi:ATP-binding protein [Methylobacterium ajmalii]|jgi:hypothetical protein|uniref:ATP-binding protein n=1 Tax=Methylobacterium ajmalii TaxID=2738439 RepID=UPI003D156054
MVDQVDLEPDEIIIRTHPRPTSACCPGCGEIAARPHSCYTRTLADLPWQGRRVVIALQTRQWRCSQPHCPRRVFAMRLTDPFVPYLVRRLDEGERHATRLWRELQASGFRGGVMSVRLCVAALKGGPPRMRPVPGPVWRRPSPRRTARLLLTGSEHGELDGRFRTRRNLVITGPCGVGKSWLACAPGTWPAGTTSRLYYQVPRLFAALSLACGNGRYGRLLRQIAKVNLLILVDWGPEPLLPEQARDHLEVVEDRYDGGSTLIDHQPGPGGSLVRDHRPHARRCRPRPAAAQRPPYRTRRREPAQTQGGRARRLTC